MKPPGPEARPVPAHLHGPAERSGHQPHGHAQRLRLHRRAAAPRQADARPLQRGGHELLHLPADGREVRKGGRREGDALSSPPGAAVSPLAITGTVPAALGQAGQESEVA